MLCYGCGLFLVFEQDEPAPLTASMRAERYELYRAPSWANQTTLRVLPIGGTAPYSYEWMVVEPTGRVEGDCLDPIEQGAARFTANGGDGPYSVQCAVTDALGERYVASTVLQVGGDIGLDITTERLGVMAGGGSFGRTAIRLNPEFGIPPFRVSWTCTGPDGRPDNDRLDVTDPMMPWFTSSDLVGRYVLTATIVDSRGQTATESFIILVGQDLGLDVAAERSTVLPGGGPDGMVRLLATPIGGTEPYSYDWEVIGPDGQPRTELLWDARTRSPVFESDEQTGTFLARCAVTDGVGVVLIGSTTVVVGQAVTVNIVADRLNLPAGAGSGHTARLTADVRGGHDGVTIAWEVIGPDGGDATSLLSTLAGAATTFTPDDTPGSYVARCTVTDGEGTSAGDSLTLFVGGTLGVVVTASNPWPATGGVVPFGTARLSTRVYGGVAPYVYAWIVVDPAGVDDAARLDDAARSDPTFTSTNQAGRYLVACTVTDALGSVTADGVILNVGQPLNVDITVDKQSLTGGGGVSGQAQLITTVNGGVAPYAYQWTVYDPNNLAAPTRLSDAQIANPVFTSDLTTGTYRATLTTTDSMGVVFVDSVELVVGSTGGGAAGQNLSASVSIDRQTIASNGGSATASVLTTGGVAPLAYTWSVTDPLGNPANTALDSTSADTIVFTSPAVQGTYRLRCTVGDAVGNLFTDSVQLTVSDDFHLDLSAAQTHIVPGGAVDLTADRTGGSGPFTYSWSCYDSSGNPAGGFAFGPTGAGSALTAGADDLTNTWQAGSGLAALGSYRITVIATDSAGRGFTDSVLVLVTDSMIVQLTSNRVHLASGQSIALTADRTGGSPNFTYTWTSRNVSGGLAGAFTTGSTGTGSATQTSADDVANTWTAPAAGPGTLGTYRIAVTAADANGVSYGSTLMVIVDDPFSLDVRATDGAIAAGSATVLTADRTGGERNFSFAWTARNSAGVAGGSFSSGSTGAGTASQTNRTNDTTNTWTAPAGVADTYLITCVATDALGKTFTDSTQVRVGEDNPLQLHVSAARVFVEPGDVVNLTGDQRNGVANFGYAWTAVNSAGSPAGTLGAASQSGLAGDAANTWTAPAVGPGVLGTYRISATVTDALGRQALDVVHVVVRSPLSLDLRANTVLVGPSTAVTLTADRTGGEPPYDFSWQVVDSAGAAAGVFTVDSTGAGLALQWNEPDDAANSWSAAAEDVYTVLCTVTDNSGQTFSDSLSLRVTTEQTLLLDLAVDQLSAVPGETINLAAARLGGRANFNYTWSVVDESGASVGGLGAVTQNGLAGDAANTWTAPSSDGTYRITCSIMDAAARRASDSAFVRVSSLAVQNVFLDPPAADTTSVLPATNLNATALGADPGIQLFAVNGLTHPSHPRNLVVTIQDTNDSILGGFARITGLDARGLPQSEVIAIAASSGSFSTNVGLLPFAAVERVDVFGFTGTINVFGQVDTISIGCGTKFGLTGLLRTAGDVPYVYEGSTVLTAGFVLDLTAGQQGVTFATPPNGSRTYVVVLRAR